METLKTDALKFVALDTDDLEVVSAHVQDAEVKAADIHWIAAQKRLVLGIDRFDWLAALAGEDGAAPAAPSFRRCRAALRFERVLSCKCRGVDRNNPAATLSLLAVSFAPTDAPGGAIILTFSDGAVIRAEVECLEAELADLGPAWPIAKCPLHETEDTPTAGH
ncbi:MAG TPA: DUF2948 family protein [Xanthobacteraceae bacterium]|jgi:hypothetical protein|nr:DUF2948 family protein [Xanthobacteraceae bacterium]